MAAVDEADRAQVQEEAMLEFAIAAARGVLPAETVSAKDCDQCGEPIEPVRRQAVRGCRLCHDCAERVESLRRRGLL